MLGKKHSEESKEKIRESEKRTKQGSKVYTCLVCHKIFIKNKYRNSKCCSLECSNLLRIGKPTWNKGKKYPQISGSKHYAWKGGITPLHFKIRGMIENRQWIKSVLERYCYTCQKCGRQGSYLIAHHIKPFSLIFNKFLQEYNQFSPIEDKETLIRLAINYKPFWDIDNGIAYCWDCHKNLPKKLQTIELMF